MNRFEVHLDLAGRPIPMGEVEVAERAGRIARCEFAYRSDYLGRPDRLMLDPHTSLSGGRWVASELPRGLADAGPDGWGRSLLLRANRGRGMTDAELLLAVDDTSRIGALRLRTTAEGPWEASGEGSGEASVGTKGPAQAHSANKTSVSASGGTKVPALIKLAELSQDAAEVEADPSGQDAVRRLVGAGSASLGGARPKASVLTGEGRLAIAKFASRHDEISVIVWEKLCLDLAAQAGVLVPVNRLLRIKDEPVLLLDRFDRDRDGHRVPYLSAFALTGAPDPASGDYLDIGESLTEIDTADLGETLRQLWRRVAFNVAVRNTDDHLKNHAILWSTGGWRLSPAFDITPNQVGGTTRATGIAGEDLPSKEPRALRQLGDEFGISGAAQRAMLVDVLAAASRWRDHARGLGISTEIDQLARPLDDAQRGLAELADQL